MGWLERLRVPLGWKDVGRRTARQAYADNLFGWAAELAYYFFLALFPALLFVVALASFFPVHDLMNDVLAALGRFAPTDVLGLVRDQLVQISKNNNGGLLTIGILGTIWSASSGMSAVSSVLNRAYHVEEGRSWARVRTTAVLLTIALAVFVLVSFALVVAGPEIADKVADSVGLGAAFRWTWKIVQWPVVFALIVTGFGLVYYFSPDVKQEWKWITPGSVLAALVWILISLGFRWYVSAFANYQKTYGAIGGAIVALLWFYVSGVAMLLGAELNAVIEHASPLGKDPGEKVPGEREATASGRQERRLRPDRRVRREGGPRRVRPSEIAVGAGALLGEIVALLTLRRRRTRTP